MILTKKEAKKLMLLHQNLLQNKSLMGKAGILAYVKKVGCLQFDPLNVIAMNPHLVLQSRIKNYKREQLDGLLYEDRLLMDGWDKCMAIYPIEDRPYFSRHYNSAMATHLWRHHNLENFFPVIREKIRSFGPVSSSDLKMKDKIDWAWAPTSIARASLELMFFTGELIVQNKIGSRKIYDFTASHLPEELLKKNDPNTTEEDYFKWGVLRRVNALGLMWDKRSEAWLGIKGLKTLERKKAFQSLLNENKIIQLNIENFSEDFYMDVQYKDLINQLDNTYVKKVHFIAALDNFLWDRPLIKSLFDFDYKWEVYTPEKDRKYGYYVLPILFGEHFIGRIEPRFNDKSRILTLHNIWIETNQKKFEKPLLKALKSFADFLGATTIVLDETSQTLDLLKILFPLEELSSYSSRYNTDQ